MKTRPLALLGLSFWALSCSRPGPSKPGPQPSPSPSAASPKGLPDPLPAVAARVNGQIIPTRNVLILAGKFMLPVRKDLTFDEQKAFAFREALDRLVIRELFFQEALARRVAPDERTIEAAYNEVRVPYQEEKGWSDFLKSQGLTAEAFRMELRSEHTVQALINLEARGVPDSVSDEEARAFFEANRAVFATGERLRVSQILLRTAPDMPKSRRNQVGTQAEAILARLRSGEDFAVLARKLSEDAVTAGSGGELPVISHGQMPKGFELAAFALKPGEVSGVVSTPTGFHIIKLLERLPSVQLGFDDVKDNVKHALVIQRRQEAVDKLLATLKAKAKIEIYV